MRLIVLFSGQGGLRREHVLRLRASAPPDVAEPLRAALRLLDVQTAALTEAQWAANRLAQPLICAYQLALWRELAPLLPSPVLVAGYSLGELAAFACAGAFSPGDAVTLAYERARLMDEATAEPSGLLAVLGLDEAQLRARSAASGTEIAIRNGPRHFIVGGTRRALAVLAREATLAGATRTTMLCVTTPSHTGVLKAAAVRFAGYLRPCLRDRMDVPVLSGVEAQIVRGDAAVAAVLERQICTRLDWAACMETLLEHRPDAVLELGPGNALAKMLLELEPQAEVRAVDEFRDLRAAAQWVGSRRQSV